MKLDGKEYEVIYSKVKNIYIQIKEGKVLIKVPEKTSKKELEKIIIKQRNWIEKSLLLYKQKQEKKVLYTEEKFKEIVQNNINELIQKTGLIPNKITIKDIKYAWGTCSAKRNITINFNLIKYSEKAIRYVILHELCHLQYMNHSKDFWNLVEKYMPDYKEAKMSLKYDV